MIRELDIHQVVDPGRGSFMVNSVTVTANGKPKKWRGRPVYVSAFDVKHGAPSPEAYEYTIR